MEENMTFNDENVSMTSLIGKHDKSTTQSIRVAVIEKSGKSYLSIQKWWRKSGDEDWKEGKGFHLSSEEVQLIKADLDKATEYM